VTRQSGGVPTASAIPTAGPLGATNVQSALDLIAAAGPFFTTEETPSVLLSSTYTPIKTLSIATGSTRTLFAILHVTRGTAPSPDKAAAVILASAKRTSGGTTSAISLASMQSFDISGFNMRWAVSGTDLEFAVRVAGSPQAARVLLQYVWLEQLPP